MFDDYQNSVNLLTVFYADAAGVEYSVMLDLPDLELPGIRPLTIDK